MSSGKGAGTVQPRFLVRSQAPLKWCCLTVYLVLAITVQTAPPSFDLGCLFFVVQKVITTMPKFQLLKLYVGN